MTVKPLGDRVVIKNVEAEETTKSGLIAHQRRQGKAADGGSAGRGPRRYGGRQGSHHAGEAWVEKVIYSKYAGTEVKIDGEEIIIVRQSDILAVVE